MVHKGEEGDPHFGGLSLKEQRDCLLMCVWEGLGSSSKLTIVESLRGRARKVYLEKLTFYEL